MRYQPGFHLLLQVVYLLFQSFDAVFPGGAHEKVIGAALQHLTGGTEFHVKALTLRGVRFPAIGTAGLGNIPA